MRKVAISTIATVSAGQGAPKQNEFSDSGIPFVRAGSLDILLSGRRETELELISEETAKKYKLKLYPRGSILFAKSGMSATKDRIYVLKNSAYVVSHLAILVPKNTICAKYLRLVLIQFPPSRLIKDLAYPAISLGEIQDYKIPIPEELDDQKRIAYLLSKVERLIAQRKQHLRHLDDLLKSIFLEMFGDPVRNEKGWDKKPFSEILVDIESGKSPNCEAREADDGEWGILKLGSITSCVYKQSENKALPEDVNPQTKFEVKPGDLLFSRKNTYELVAACAYVFKTRPKLLIPDLIFRFVFKDDAEVNPIFISQLLTSSSQRKKIQSLASGAAGSMPNISKEKLKQILLPIPPTKLQDRFVAIVEKFEIIKSRYQQSLIDLETLYSALSQKAFKGELDLSRVPLPLDDPEAIAEPPATNQLPHTADTFHLPAPSDLATLNSPEGRTALLDHWLTLWLERLNNTPFSTQPFIDAAQQRLWELVEQDGELAEEDALELGAADYDYVRSWISESLERRHLAQTYNDDKNRVQLKAVSHR